MALFGFMWPIALFVVAIIVFTILNLVSFPILNLTYLSPNLYLVGPITVCLMYEALTVFTSAAGGSESLSRIIGLLIRVIPVMAIYFSFLARPSRYRISL